MVVKSLHEVLKNALSSYDDHLFLRLYKELKPNSPKLSSRKPVTVEGLEDDLAVYCPAVLESLLGVGYNHKATSFNLKFNPEGELLPGYFLPPEVTGERIGFTFWTTEGYFPKEVANPFLKSLSKIYGSGADHLKSGDLRHVAHSLPDMPHFTSYLTCEDKNGSKTFEIILE